MPQTPRTTPFHARVAPLNQTGIWKHWSGYLVPPSYHFSLNHEYYAIRNAAALLDTSPLFKYRISGSGAEAFLCHVLARDVRACRPGRAQYTCWCDERGFVLQDGVILHVKEGEYWLTAAEPTLRYFRNVARAIGSAVEIEDVSLDYGILALQGPRAHDVLSRLTDDATPLRFFGACSTRIAGCDVMISRTGYTGDLGYELWIASPDAETVWDALMSEGGDYNLTPMGTTPLKMARMEAGLLLMGVDFQMSRFAWVDEERDTPLELGWSWMFRKLDSDDRDFIGRSAIQREMEGRTSRWKTVGLAVDWDEYEAVHTEVGLLPPRHEIYRETTMSVYRRGDIEWDYAGYSTSFATSSLLRKPLAIAKVPLDLSEPGAEVDLELSVLHRPRTVLARVERLPFFDPPRKTAAMGGDS